MRWRFFTWYRKASEQGHAEAQYNLGYWYWHGIGVAKDARKAVEWYREAADQGDKPAARVESGVADRQEARGKWPAHALLVCRSPVRAAWRTQKVRTRSESVLSALKRAGNGTRTRDPLLGKQMLYH